MYCKYCGNEIADDSRFCKHCGKIVEETENIIVESLTQEANITEEADTARIEVVLTAKDNRPIPVEISKTSKFDKALIANEIVGNLKMVILAFLFSGTYFLINLAINYNPVDNILDAWDVSLERGVSINKKDEFLNSYWEYNYSDQIHKKYYIPDWPSKEPMPYSGNFKRYFDNGLMTPFSEWLKVADKTAAMYLSDEEINRLKANAQKNGAIQQKALIKEVNTGLWRAFWWKTSDTYIVTIIVTLILSIGGRYLLKLIRWVKSNRKTE